MTARQIPEFENTDFFFSRFEIIQESGCWEWIASINGAGYGQVRIRGRTFAAHRVSYSIHKGELDLELVIDHMCRNRKCVNPEHLRQVTPKTNTLENSEGVSAKNKKKTHCWRGHEFNEKNTWKAKGKYGGRHCRVCAAIKIKNKKLSYETRVLMLAEILRDSLKILASPDNHMEYESRVMIVLSEIEEIKKRENFSRKEVDIFKQVEKLKGEVR